VTGRLCPTCGMTTSYAWLMRGRLDRSWRSNPAGLVFALLSMPLGVWLVWSAGWDEPVGFHSLAGPLTSLLVAAVVLCLAVWLVRLTVSPVLRARPGPRPEAVFRMLGL